MDELIGATLIRRSPWKRGFQPPSKCPFCKRINSLLFTGKRRENGDHIYRCLACKQNIGAPTNYGYCDKSGFPERIEKDVFYSECLKCRLRTPYPTGKPGGGVCRHLRIRPYEEFI